MVRASAKSSGRRGRRRCAANAHGRGGAPATGAWVSPGRSAARRWQARAKGAEALGPRVEVPAPAGMGRKDALIFTEAGAIF